MLLDDLLSRVVGVEVMVLRSCFFCVFFFFQQKTAYEISACLVGSEMCIRGREVTLEQILPALPPPGIAGSIPAVDLVDPQMKRLLENPDLVVKPRDQWPASFRKTKMFISRPEWELVGPELVRRKIFRPIEADKLIKHNGKVLLNSIFGVSKGKEIWSDKKQQMVEILRLIINLTPSNELQEVLDSDIGTLPHFAQWCAIELGLDEILIWGQRT